MKKTLFLLTLCLIGMHATAQKPYAIYDWTCQASIKEYKGDQWSPIRKDQAVSGLDSIQIAEKGTLRVIDTRTNLIYRSTKTGKMRILNLINDAKSQNSRTLSAVNQELLKSAKSATGTPTMQVVGATTRGDDERGVEDSIAATLGWIAKQAYEEGMLPNASDLILRCHVIPEGVYFEMENQSDRGYYVNVLHINRQTRKMNLCYIIDPAQAPDAPFLFLPKDQSVQLKELVFDRNQANDIYLLVGTEDAYIPEQMQTILQYMDMESVQALYPRYKCYKVQ